MRPYDAICLSCEHATNHVPRPYRYLFSRHEKVLDTHLGYDIGIKPVADRLSNRLQCPLVQFPLSRLLIEPNRSQRHRLFSAYSQKLPESDKDHLIRAYYQPFRQALRQQVVFFRKTSKTVLHVSLHSFTPVWHRQKRRAHIGLLYDPARTAEVSLARYMQARLSEQTQLRIRRNYPYRGTADGTVTWLRRQFPADAYVGLEIELNQAWLQSRAVSEIRRLCDVLSDGLVTGIESQNQTRT